MKETNGRMRSGVTDDGSSSFVYAHDGGLDSLLHGAARTSQRLWLSFIAREHKSKDINELLQMLGCVIVSDKLPSEHHVLIDNLIYALAVLGPRTSVI
jgi:hypothetical protein